MAINKYEKDGQTFWQVYIDLRGRKDPKIRVQKRVIGLKSEREARAEEKRLVRQLSEEVSKQESKGATWEEVIERWVRQQELYPTRKLSKTTIMDYGAVLRNWTKLWLKRPACEISRADGRDVFRQVEDAGRSQISKGTQVYNKHGLFLGNRGTPYSRCPTKPCLRA